MLRKYLKTKLREYSAQKEKEKFFKNESINYLLFDRGFFSEINNLIFGIYFCEKNGKKIVIDNSCFSYEWENDEQCIFESNYNFIKQVNKKSLEKERKKFYKSYLWHSIRSNNFKNELSSKEVKEKLKEILKKLYNLKFFSEITKDLDKLPKEYIGLHIRRGDKVKGETKEADEVELKEYIKRIPQKYEKLPLFIATDDKEVLEEVKINYPNKKVYSFFNEKNVRKNEKEFNRLEKEKIKEHTLEFLKEVEALSNSSYFIGSYSSNVGRFIALRRGFENCDSVDCNWEDMH